MERIIPFKKTDFSNDGTHILSDKFIYDLQREWEESSIRFLQTYWKAIRWP